MRMPITPQTEKHLWALASEIEAARARLASLAADLREELGGLARGDLLDHDQALHDVVTGALADAGCCPECMEPAEERLRCGCGYDEARG